MALTIENTIDLTAYAGNPEPKVVSQLSIIHESSDGELVQYYIEARNQSQGDKNAHAIGVYDQDTQTWSYHDYPELVWGEPGQRICGNRIERLGVKAFPSLGAIAFYKLAHRKITRIVAPVNRKDNRQKAPELDAVVNPDGTVAFTITPPDKPEYECYRIVMDSGIYAEEYVTYDLELTAPAPHISGEYKCYAVGYGEEGLLFSKESNIITLTLTGQSETFEVENNPMDPSQGTHTITFSRHLWIEQEDFLEEPVPKYKRMYPGNEVRLKGAYLVTCTGCVKDEDGNITEVLCEYDPQSRGGNPADGRKVKGATIHWVDAETCVDAEVRLYENLFNDPNPDAPGKDFLEAINPDSLIVLNGCKVERSMVDVAKEFDQRENRTGTNAPTFQFMRVGFFCLDNKDSSADHLVFNRSVLLRDGFEK